MRKRILATALLLVIAFSLFPTAAMGQNVPFTLIGFVYDTDRETLLAGAQVTLTNQRTNESLIAIAEDGSYLIDISAFDLGLEDGDTIRVFAEKEDRIGDNSTAISIDGEPYNQIDVFTISEKPRIDHLPIVSVDEGSTVRFSAVIIDDIGILGAELRIWQDDWEEPILGPEGLDQDGNTWSTLVSIPSDGSIYWPGFHYNISATDGRYTVSTPPQYIILNDTSPPVIHWNSTDVLEGDDIAVAPKIIDDHGIIGASLTYGIENITLELPTEEWNGSAILEGTIPGVDVRVPGISVTINVWDNNNTRRETYPITVKDITPPTAISTFTATHSIGSLNITLDWGKPTDNVGVEAYLLERSTDEENWTWSNEIPSGRQTYVDVEGMAHTQYFYRIRARDAAYNYGGPAYANATTIDLSPPTIAHTPNDEWEEGDDLHIEAVITDDIAVASAHLEYNNGTYSETLALTFDGSKWSGTIPGTSMRPAAISNGTRGLTYKITASDGANWRETREFHVWIRDNTPPTGFNLSASLFGGKPHITWEEAKDDLQIIEYWLAVDTTPLATTPGQYEMVQWGEGYTLEDALPGTHYYFAVSAYDGRNNGPWIEVDIATPALVDDTTPPDITHNAPTSSMEKENLALEAIITDDVDVAGAIITYWQSNIGDGGSVTLTYAGGNKWRGILPFSAMIGDSVHYTINASDTSGNTALSGTTTSPYIVDLISRDVAVTTTPQIGMNMTPGEDMSFEVVIATNANATWYIFLGLEGIESYNATLGNQSIELDGKTPVYLEMGAYELNITLVFPIERKATSIGTLYINQTDASSTAEISLVFEGEEEDKEESFTSFLIYVFVAIAVGLLLLGASMANRLRPKRS